MADYIGEQFGNYRLVELLGKGGFAHVYRGEHIHLGNKAQAAIKVLTIELTNEMLVQFRVEALTLMELEHSHIVRILDCGMEDVGTSSRIPYIVMNYAPKGSLRDLHPLGTRISPQTVVTYVKQIASALQYAHDKKFIHRDVKPDNMLIGSNNEVLLSDFGIVTIAHSKQSNYTKDGPGSPHYNAPEQIQGKPMPASDQYALAVVVYEWLTGTWPFVGSSQIEIALKHLQEPPPPLRGRVPSIPFAVEHVVLRALAKDPEQRFASVQKFAERLERAYVSSYSSKRTILEEDISTSLIVPKSPTQSDLQTQLITEEMFVTPPNTTIIPQLPSSKTASHSGISRRAVVLGGAAVLAAATGVAGIDYGLGIVKWTKTTLTNLFPPGGKVVFTFRNQDAVTLSASWSPSSKYIVTAGSNIQIWEALTGTMSLNLNNKFCYKVAWSPNGKYIALGGGKDWSSTGTLQVISSTDGNVRFTRDEIGYVTAISWSPDSKYIAIATGMEVHICNAGNGDTILSHQDFPGDVTIYPGDASAVAWSPDGKSIASGVGNGHPMVKVWDAVSGATHITYSGHKYWINSIAWSPDSKWIVSSGADNYYGDIASTHIWDAKTGIRHMIWQEDATEVDWAPNGEYIALAYVNGIGVRDAKDGSLLAKYSSGPDGAYGAKWSPNSQYIASIGKEGSALIWQPF